MNQALSLSQLPDAFLLMLGHWTNVLRASWEARGAKQGSGGLSRAGNEPAAFGSAGLSSLALSTSVSTCDTGLALQVPPSFPMGSSEITPVLASTLTQSLSDRSLPGQGQGLSRSAARTVEHPGTVSRGLGCCEFLRPRRKAIS